MRGSDRRGLATDRHGFQVRLLRRGMTTRHPGRQATRIPELAASALPSKVLSEAAARDEGSPRDEEAPAGTFFERFRNLDLDAL